MHVAIVGAGSLGSVYGARLACLAACDVSIVAKAPTAAIEVRLERVDNGEVLRWMAPARVEAAPRDADVVLALVRYEQLSTLPSRVSGGTAPVVVMTPMMPRDQDRLSAELPGRLIPGMPSVLSYLGEGGAFRYWLPRMATTLIDSRPAHADVLSALVERLVRAEISARLEHDVLARNVATTVSFMPLAMALDVAGSIDGLLTDDTLLHLALDAVAEARDLGRTVGKAESWASILLRFVGHRTLKVGVGLARARSPEACFYIEQHFGRKLHAQNVRMAQGIVELAAQKDVPHGALDRLSRRLGSATLAADPSNDTSE